VHANEVALPAGTTLVAEPDSVVVHVMAQVTAEQLEAELAGAEAELAVEAAATEEGEAAPEAEQAAEAAPAEDQAPGE